MLSRPNGDPKMSRADELQALGFAPAGTFRAGQFHLATDWTPHQVVYVWAAHDNVDILRVGIACGEKGFGRRYASYNRWLAGRFKPDNAAEQEKARLFRSRLDDSCTVWARRAKNKASALIEEGELRRLFGPILDLDLMTPGWAKLQMAAWREARRNSPPSEISLEPTMENTSDADRVRQYAFDTYIAPTRQRSEPLVIIRAGDIAAKLGLTGTLPQVCGALGATTFETQFQVRRVYLHGPINGANTYFVFDVKPAV